MITKKLSKRIYQRVFKLWDYSVRGALLYFKVKISNREVVLLGSCFQCGGCCRKINIQTNSGWITSLNQFKKLCLDHPEYSRFSPIGKESQGFISFTCNWLTDNGTCKDHPNRLAICKNYPDKEMIFHSSNTAKGCGFRVEDRVPFARVLNNKIKNNRKN